MYRLKKLTKDEFEIKVGKEAYTCLHFAWGKHSTRLIQWPEIDR